ncbi:nucleoside deoxyribosyltransferase [Weissella viridescens]|uniref:Purine deoxyribosyltransferase n=2 Tax=Weissella viridescens TaxID=1629 RepID=A0A0R2H1D7_WEIVI|nr:nucleoside 2-deoxyribosyltransferase [Weissella viridescens]KRN46155.1 purine deoxyribosyltransferase [Weissella viridescens]MCB6840841.1 nucleoside 2-deoxyribosyltransferase [Weissella viridescens]MCB6847574.1 nucleoside 2-deoxyribosyltransferase [Weissella viridescens]WJI91745.1 nucleoside 2-deoxyribosyltransferase [Weissella viridescens]GEA95442.1 nucleoside deoxyribosyltransferase [Weissella viridescens]
MKNVYLAGPFFDAEQIERIERMEQALTNNPTVASFFSPRSETCAEFEMGTREWAAATFKVDRDHIDQADVVVAVIDYVDDFVDPGTAWEIGYANANQKPVILLKEKPNGSVNLMMAIPAHAVLLHVSDVAQYDFDEMPTSEWTGDMF